MKKTALLMAGLLMVSLTVASAGEGTEAKWFDMENCAFCKNILAHPGLLENMKWKNYNISHGMITITTVPAEYKPAYMEASKAMEELGTKMMTGAVDPTTVTMCGHCQAYGAFMQSGVVFDYVQADVGDIVVMTSDSPEQVAEIQKFGKRNETEAAKLMKEMQSKKTQ